MSARTTGQPVRVILAILVAVVQTGGPWLCCCGPARLLAAAPSPAPANARTAPDAEPACPHCRAAAKPAQVPVEDGKPAPKAPAPLSDRCPCGGVTIEAVAPVPTTVDPPTHLDAFWPPAFAAAWPVSLAVSPGTGRWEDRDRLPFLSAADRLFAHHALRC